MKRNEDGEGEDDEGVPTVRQPPANEDEVMQSSSNGRSAATMLPSCAHVGATNRDRVIGWYDICFANIPRG